MIHRALEHRARALVALLLVAIAGLTLAACGSDDNGGGSGGGDTADARTLLRDTFSGTKDIRSGRVALNVRLAETGGENLSVGLSGPFENTGGDAYPKFDIALDARLGAQGSFSAGLVSTSDRLYVELEGNAYEIPAEFLDTARQQTGTDRRLAIPDLDPQSWIEDPEVVGQEQVGGADTDHISGTVNVTALLDSFDRVLAEVDRQGLGAATGGQLPTSIPADTRAEIERTVKDPRVDVWTGTDDKTLRKLEVNLGIEPPRGERGGTVSFVLELSDLNAAQTIEAPTNVRPIDELLAGLGSLLGSSGLGGSSGGGASTEGLDEYQRCITEAGADVAEAQKCADLLTR